jgi:hypothetical protein
MKKVVLTSSLLLVAGVAVLVASSAFAHGDNGKGGKARLNGYQEVSSISTTGHGSFRAKVRSDGIHYMLRYEDLESNASAAHIHFAQKGVNGDVIAFLCGGGDKPACPAKEGEVTGVIDAADVIGPAGRGIAPGELDEVIRALRHGAVYANVHTATYGGGEIRGQVGHTGHHHGKGDRK